MSSPFLALTRLVALFCGASVILAAGDAGLCYRGWNNSGVFPAAGLLKEWPPGGPELLWKYPLDIGFSSVTVAGGKVYATGGETHRLYTFSLDGKLESCVRLGSSSWKRFSGTRSTPIVAGGIAVSSTPDATLYAVDLSTSARKWSVNAWKNFGSGKGGMGWGYPESPLYHDGKVIFNTCSRDTNTPPIVAVDIRTGKTVWEADAGTTNRKYSASDVSGALVNHRGRDIVLYPTWRYLVCLDAKTGKRLWEIAATGVKSITPIYADGYVLWDPPGGAQMLKLADDAESFKVLWMRPSLGGRFSHGVILDRRLYAFGDSGSLPACTDPADGTDAPPRPAPSRGGSALLCMDVETGRTLHSEPAATPGHVIAADGMVYAVDLVTLTNNALRPRIWLIRPTAGGFETAGRFVPELTDTEVGVREVEWQASVAPFIAEGCLFFRYGPLQVYELRAGRTAEIRTRRERVARVTERLRAPAAARRGALSELATMGPDARFATTDVAPLLLDADAAVRKAACAALAEAGPAAIGLLVRSLTNGTVWTEGFVGAALVTATGAGDLPAALVAAGEGDAGLRDTVKPMLTRFGDRPVPSLNRVIETADKNARWWAMDVLRAMGPDARGSVPQLVYVSRAYDQWFREYAAHTLGAIGKDAAPAVPAMIELLGHPYNRARAAAAGALASMGDRRDAVVQALQAAAADSDAEVSAAASNALKRLGFPAPTPVPPSK
jgi:outer membrane protein assembly factor BamB/HEAT repeat protein